MIDWAFLDVGNVILDEDPLTFRVFEIHAEAVRARRPDLSSFHLLAAREEASASGSRWPLYEVVSRHLDEAGCEAAWVAADREVRANYARLSPAIEGADDLIRALASRFRLGLIANQGAECRGRLQGLGWLDRFEVIALSEEEGAYKPDVALFEQALGRAGIEAGRAVMVGDRLDNDVAPASGLGMATARVRWPDRGAKGWRPETPEGRAYLGMLERLAISAESRAAIAPTIAADDLRGLIPGLLALP